MNFAVTRQDRPVVNDKKNTFDTSLLLVKFFFHEKSVLKHIL